MKVNDFINKLVEIEKDGRNIYVWGANGQPITLHLLSVLKIQYPNWYTSARMKTITDMVDKGWGFDCSGLIKSVVWGFNFTKGVRGGAVYKKSSDFNANTMISKCKNQSTNFKNIVRGALVWMDGHVGIYIGDGIVIETSPRWKNKVQRTYLRNLGFNKGNGRTWTKWGLLPFITYDEETITPSTFKEGDKVAYKNPESVNGKLYGKNTSGHSFRLWYSDYKLLSINEQDKTAIIGKGTIATANVNLEDLERK